MNLLIDATNIIAGGGLSHLQELLNNTSKETLIQNGFEKIYLVGVDATLGKIKDRSWLKKLRMGSMQNNFIKRNFWKWKNLDQIILENNIGMIFNPGGSLYTRKLPYVTMCRNMLVFETEEANRFDSTIYRFKFHLLRIFQSKSMKNATGVIFISEYAKSYINENYPHISNSNSVIIHHGVSERFQADAKIQYALSQYNTQNPFKLLYVSILDVYKHHAKIAEAIVGMVKEEGLPLELTVVGDKAGGFIDFEKVMRKNPETVKYLGKIPFERMQEIYHSSDAFIFGSTCENMPNILIEAMSSGLPIICSDKQPMPEFLGEGGTYFQVESIESIKESLREFLISKSLREEKLKISKQRVSQYSWEKCSAETFAFLKKSYEKERITRKTGIIV